MRLSYYLWDDNHLANEINAFVASTSESEIGTFGFRHEGGGYNCVEDGDTIYYQSVKIRVADIDTPETHEPRFSGEAQPGSQAVKRLHDLINAGASSLEPNNRDEDAYGRARHKSGRL